MLSRIVLAVVVGIVAALVCILLGGLLVATGLSVIASVGAFLRGYAGLIGVLVGLWYFLGGRASLTP